MKPPFHPRRFAQVILGFAALTFTQCNKPAVGRIIGDSQEKDLQIDDMKKLRQIQIAMKMYANDNDGNFPVALPKLAPKYISNESILEFTDHRSKQRMPWLYHNALTDTSDMREVHVAVPVATPDGNRWVLFVDGTVRNIPEAEFQTFWSREYK